MATELGTVWVKYAADLSNLKSGASQAKSELSSVSAAAQASAEHFGMLKQALSFAAGQAIFQGFSFLKDQLGSVFEESMNAQAGMAQTNKVLQTTHDASGQTAQGIADLAGNLSHLTQFSDDTVQAAENMIATFTNVKGNVFPQATKTVLDMSQALGQDTKSSAIQLGKALNDPLTGITALQRVGVTFTKGQKDSITAMMDHGQIAKAQGVILSELQKEFGGSAEAAGKTFGGQLKILGQRMDDVRQTLGDALMPYLTKLVSWISASVIPALTRFSDWFVKTAIPAVVMMVQKGSEFITWMQQGSDWATVIKVALAAVAGIIVAVLAVAFYTWAAAAAAAAIATLAATWPILAIGAAIGLVVAGIILAVKNWGAIVTWLGNLWHTVLNWMGNLWATVSGWIGDRFSWLGDHVHGIINAIGGLFSWIGARFSALGSFFHAVGQAIGGIFSWSGGLIHDEILCWEMLFSWIGNRFSALGSFFQTIAGAIGAAFSGLGSLISGVWNGIVGDIRQAINWIISMINGFIGGIDSIGIDIGPVHIHPNIPQIPYLASGGYIESTGLAMVHAGESVVPARASSGGVGGTQTVILEVDSVQLAQVNARATDRIVRLKLGAGGRAP